MSEFQNPTPVGDQAANPSPEPAQSAGTIQQGGEANGQSAPANEGFTKLDPNTLPPQLRSAYDNMLRDYKEKTTRLSEERKKYEGFDTFKQKAELYEQIASQQEFVQQWNDFVQKRSGQNGQQADPTAEVKAQLEEIKSKLQQSELSEVVESFSSAKNEKGELVNPDFDVLNSVTLGKNNEGEEFSLLRACIELSPGNSPQERLAMGYKTAKSIRDQIIEEGRKQGMGRMLSKVRNSTEAPTITSDKQSFNGDAKNLSVREARELAEKGVKIH